jgi:hypothetical protein
VTSDRIEFDSLSKVLATIVHFSVKKILAPVSIHSTVRDQVLHQIWLDRFVNALVGEQTRLDASESDELVLILISQATPVLGLPSDIGHIKMQPRR